MIKQTHIVPEIIVTNLKGDESNIGQMVQSIKIEKDVNQPVGTASLVLNPSREGNNSTTITHSKIIAHLKKMVALNSTISIKMDKSYKKHSFFGFIDHVYESTVTQGSSTQRTLNINCSTLLPKLLLRDDIVNYAVLSGSEVIKKELGERVKFFGWMRGNNENGNPFVGLPEEAVKWILDNTPATNINGGDPKKYINPRVIDVEGKSVLDFKFLTGELLADESLSLYTGSILNYIYKAIDKKFYEVFFDTTTGKDGLPYSKMVIRPKPLSFKDYKMAKEFKAVDNWMYWEDLDEVEITSDVRFTENLGVNDYEVKTCFAISFSNALISSANLNDMLSKFGLQYPVLNLDGVKRLGLRNIHVTSTMINTNRIKEEQNKQLKDAKEKSKSLSSISDLMSDKEKGELHYLLAKREKVVEWNAFPYYESGQMSIVGDERITIGKKLIYKDKKYYDVENDKEYTGVEYYIKGVTESYSYGGFYTQNLRLSRGIPKGVAVEWLNENRPKFVSIDMLEENKESVEIPIIDSKNVWDKREQRLRDVFTIVPPSI